jgi:uncharacterized protein (TIGR03382 family)
MEIRDRLHIQALLLVAVSALAGCGGDDITVEDDITPDTGRRAENDRGDVLHAPYATGTNFAVKVRDMDSDECHDLTFEVDAPTVVRVAGASADPCAVQLTADGPGTTELRVIEDGDEIHAVSLEVADPSRATLHPRGMVRAGLEEANASWEEARMLAGEVATFTVRWWDAGGRELAARDILRTTLLAGLVAGAGEGRLGSPDWLQVSAADPGTYEAEVGTADGVFGAITLGVVPADDVVSLELVPGEVPGDDGRSALLVIGRDAEGEPVFGLEATWTADGAPILNDEGATLEGDLLLFEEGGEERAVTADALGLDASTDISWAHDPSVESSNGCSATPGHPPPAALAMLALPLALALQRRKATR